MADLKYPFAKDESGNIISANVAAARTDYYCIDCNSVMRRRQGTKRAHFAHKTEVSNCSSESALHLGFKELLYKRIKSALDEDGEVIINWACDICEDTHQRNLISKTKRVEKELSFGACRPDISLLDESGKLIIAIEIVVTHEPEESTLQFYKESNVTLIRFKLNSLSDIDTLQNEILNPTSVDVCLNPKCNNCGHYKLRHFLYIIMGKCWKCKATMKITAIADKQKYWYSSNQYTKQELELANHYGANIQYRYSKTIDDKYNAHVCKKCNNIAGQQFLFTDYIAPAFYNRMKHEVFDIGYRCSSCLKNIHSQSD
ncbi:hypothetical protein [Paenibacillus alvei]|uniref:Competence protein CoiA-like N-terminal domain-containing protein n=1 Tax=Paenibacillus alvei TaxID=44250 RepID=A0AAP7DLS7_PAEAL|nr:hypothetical protein [Paenibacillus alvei]NOJ74076.1 hypothetical protein [Paenibacillus alvei]